MAMGAPPNPLSKEEFTKRWNAGARTMAELDPALDKWQKDNHFLRGVGYAVMAVALVVVMAFCI